MKRLTSLKHNSSTNFYGGERKHASENLTAKQRRNLVAKNNPYPESALPQAPLRPGHSHSRAPSGVTTMFSQDTGSILSCEDTTSAYNGRVLSTRSAAPTVATNPETIHSDAGHSKSGTAHTAGGALSSIEGGGNSTFSSPRHSQESLTTTLTTLQSAAGPSATNPHNPTPNQSHTYTPSYLSYATSVHAPHYIPPHLAPHPHTYSSAIANNMLTDNASVLTLASSSKRRRRHSLDTDASIRALAPSSLFGNSRESLPLSVLSSNVETASAIFPGHQPAVRAALASTERASVYSSSGIAPMVNSERNSYYAAGKPGPADGASVRSGLLGHGKTDSITGSITGIASSPLASPRDASLHGRSSRPNSDWHDPETLHWDDGVDEEEEEELRDQREREEASEEQAGGSGTAKDARVDKAKGKLPRCLGK
jgi:hypothetical protein